MKKTNTVTINYKDIYFERYVIFLYWFCIVAGIIEVFFMYQMVIINSGVVFVLSYTAVACVLWMFFNNLDDYRQVKTARLIRKSMDLCFVLMIISSFINNIMFPDVI